MDEKKLLNLKKNIENLKAKDSNIYYMLNDLRIEIDENNYQ